MNAKRMKLAVAFSLILGGFAVAGPSQPLRLEGVGTYHYNASAQAEYAFQMPQSSLCLDGGVSYGVRDWWNSLSAGATWYPWSDRAEGFFAQTQETYGFGVSGIQGDQARDWKTAATFGYRWMAFGWLTGSVAVGANYDALIVSPAGGPRDFNAGGPRGLNPALAVSLGIAFDPRQ